MDEIINISLIITLLAATIRVGTPLIMAALGEIFAERAGVLNLGVEGIMLVGAISGFYTCYATGNLWLGLAAGVLSGILFTVPFAYFCVYLGTNQIIAGISLWFLGMGLSGFIYRIAFSGLWIRPTVSVFPAWAVPVLSQIPILGDILFKQNIIIYLTLLAVPVVWFIFYKTRPGLQISAVGENPKAAASYGINVNRTRFLSVLVGGAFAGAAGAFIPLASLGTFIDNVTQFRGFIAVAIVIFARWNPLGVPVGAFVFGFMSALQRRLQVMDVVIPYQLLLALPYIATILALLLFHILKKEKQTVGPAGLTIPYEGG